MVIYNTFKKKTHRIWFSDFYIDVTKDAIISIKENKIRILDNHAVVEVGFINHEDMEVAISYLANDEDLHFIYFESLLGVEGDVISGYHQTRAKQREVERKNAVEWARKFIEEINVK